MNKWELLGVAMIAAPVVGILALAIRDMSQSWKDTFVYLTGLGLFVSWVCLGVWLFVNGSNL